MATVPQQFDWVTARSECNLNSVFHQLCNEIINDIQRVNSVRRLQGEYQFRSDTTSGGTFIVGRTVAFERHTVYFAVENGTIVYRNETTKEAPAVFTISLNKTGRCILRRVSDGEEVETWQFRREALEDLFFNR